MKYLTALVQLQQIFVLTCCKLDKQLIVCREDRMHVATLRVPWVGVENQVANPLTRVLVFLLFAFVCRQSTLPTKEASTFVLASCLSGRQDSNLRPPGPKPGALPACATSRVIYYLGRFSGEGGIRTLGTV